MAERVRLTDVSPRDGLQNEPLVDSAPIPTDRKAALVRAVASAGVDEVEITSFVSPRWVPQLGDAAELCGLLAGSKPAGVVYSALVPNERGMHDLLAANAAAASGSAGGVGGRLIDKVSVFTAASETFSRRNTNASVAETLERFGPVVGLAREHGLAVRGYVSCAVACPFEGAIEPGAVAAVSERLLGLGVDEVDLGDTIGAGRAESVSAMLEAVKRVAPTDCLVLHLHDTFGGASDCVRAGLGAGVRSFDGAAGGLGGCPYASAEGRRAPGNIAMRTLVDAVCSAGFATGVDVDRLAKADTLAASLTEVGR